MSASNVQLADEFEIATSPTSADGAGTVIGAIDPQEYVDRLITARAMNRERVVVMIGIDKGDTTVKVSATLLELNNSGVPCSVLTDGYKSSGVKAVQLLSLAVADETYEVVDEMMSSIVLRQPLFLCLDHKTKLTVTGISGGSPIHQCDVCYWDKRSGDDEKHPKWNDEERTFAKNREYHDACVADGSHKKHAQQFMNCARPPIRFLGRYNGSIQDVVVLSGLHLTINILSRIAIHGSEKPNSSNAECRQIMSAWLTSDLYLKKHHGRDAWQGNQCIAMCSPRAIVKLRRRITNLPKSKASRLMGVTAAEQPVHKATLYANALEAFHFVRVATFGGELHDDAEECIERFRAAYMALRIDVTRTVHVVLRHLHPFCVRWHCGLMHFIEQTHESVHQEYRKQLQLQYRANPQHPDAPRLMLQALLIFNTLRTLASSVGAEPGGGEEKDGSDDGAGHAESGRSAGDGAAADDSKRNNTGGTNDDNGSSRDDASGVGDDKERRCAATDEYQSLPPHSQVIC